QFSYWTGAVANNFSASTTVTMDANKTVIATFMQTGIPVGGEVAPVSTARVLATWLMPVLLMALAIGGGLVWRRRIHRV
ncbi:MAG: hypothetical protein HY670_11820, partial [Chloroflexi bacterium]|nr:hypothetical protein [Chloroflexota bacterium]